MNILITGTTGLVGKNLCDALRRHNLYAVSLTSPDYRVDISDKRQLLSTFKNTPIDTIIHLANPPDWHNSDPNYYLPVNIIGTLNLIELAKVRQASFIFISSQMVYGVRHLRRGLTETSLVKPTDWYGLSKYIAEQYLYLHHQQTRLPVTIFRPVGIFGGQDTRNLLGKFIQLARENQPLIVTGKGLTKRHFIHVSDVTTAITKSLHFHRGIRVFNLGSLQVTSVLKLASYISKLRRVPVIHQGQETRLDFYLNTYGLQRQLHLKPDLFSRINQELS